MPHARQVQARRRGLAMAMELLEVTWRDYIIPPNCKSRLLAHGAVPRRAEVAQRRVGIEERIWICSTLPGSPQYNICLLSCLHGVCRKIPIYPGQDWLCLTDISGLARINIRSVSGPRETNKIKYQTASGLVSTAL